MKNNNRIPTDKAEVRIRCPWCKEDEQYQSYHDTEWGKPVSDDRVLHEFLILESAQAGLSWITILRKRENYRKLFAGFDPKRVAEFCTDDVERILQNPGIVRNKLKVNSAVNNAIIFLEIQREYGSFYNYLYQYMPDNAPMINRYDSITDVPASSPISDLISKDLKRRGMKFFGTTICYAFMQAVGMVNDHLNNCDFKFD